MNLINAYTVLAASRRPWRLTPVPVVMETGLSPLKYYSVTSQQLFQKPAPETCVGSKNGWQSRESGLISAILSIKERQCYCLLGWLYLEFFNSNVALQYVTKANSLFWFSHPLLCDLPCNTETLLRTFLRVSTLSLLVLTKRWGYCPEHRSHWRGFLSLHCIEHLFYLNTTVASLR